MSEPLRCTPDDGVFVGWDFSTGQVKAIAFDLAGKVVAEVHLPTDLWRGPIQNDQLVEPGTSELNLLQLEGQARASVRALAPLLRDAGRLENWAAGGISATHHTSGRIDRHHVQVRRAICWNDQTLAPYHEKGLQRLGGDQRVRTLIGGPWAMRYTLSHLVKDEEHLGERDWKRTHRILPHGALAAGFLTGNFDVVSVSAAASTGIMDLRDRSWCPAMLGALRRPDYRALALEQLPAIVDQDEPLGPLAEHVALDAGLDLRNSRDPRRRPLVFPTSDDQQAGLLGGGAVAEGDAAVILGNSAVVNSSAAQAADTEQLDVMRLNWGPYLWMRCYNNGAQFVDTVVQSRPEWTKAQWDALETEARAFAPASNGARVRPFLNPEPSLGVGPGATGVRWDGPEPTNPGQRYRAALESLAYLIALGVRAHEDAGQTIKRITVSGGLARSDLACEILAAVLHRPLQRLGSEEGPALGAAITAVAGHETLLRRQEGIEDPFTVQDAAALLVSYRDPVQPDPRWKRVYQDELARFERRLPEGR